MPKKTAAKTAKSPAKKKLADLSVTAKQAPKGKADQVGGRGRHIIHSIWQNTTPAP